MKLWDRWQVRFGFALAMAIMSLLVHFAITFLAGPGFPAYITFYPSVMLVALMAGFWPGILATLVSALMVDYWISPPVGSLFKYDSSVDLVGELFFCGMGLFLCVVAHRYRKIRGHLEEQVAARTRELSLTNDKLMDQAEKLERSREEWVETFNAIPDHIAILDNKHRIVRANRAMTERLGISPEKISGLPCYKCMHDAGKPIESCPHLLMLNDHKQHVAEIHEEALGGEFLVSVTPVFNEKGELKGGVHVARDITQLKKVEEELKKAKNELEIQVEKRTADLKKSIEKLAVEIADRKKAEAALIEANEMKLLGQLTSGVAHEVRNPLNGIMAIMGALSKEVSDDDRFKPYMQHMRNQVTRLTSLMEDLLLLGRPLREENMREVSMVTLVENALSTWLQTVQTQKPSVRFIRPEQPENYMVRAETTYITQMIINLVENAYNHSPAGEEIICSVHGKIANTIIFSVKDRGNGIMEENLPKIYEPFFTTRKGGTGLGLSIVRHIVEIHDGSIIGFNNADGPGATFEVALPLYVKK
ncbi:MAG: ATP-binding protein [Chitinivibrionales bacterium]